MAQLYVDYIEAPLYPVPLNLLPPPRLIFNKLLAVFNKIFRNKNTVNTSQPGPEDGTAATSNVIYNTQSARFERYYIEIYRMLLSLTGQ